MGSDGRRVEAMETKGSDGKINRGDKVKMKKEIVQIILTFLSFYYVGFRVLPYEKWVSGNIQKTFGIFNTSGHYLDI